MAYREKRGTLNIGLRLEFLLGRLSKQIDAFAGGKTDFKDMIRYHDFEDENDEVSDFSEVAAMFGAKRVDR